MDAQAVAHMNELQIRIGSSAQAMGPVSPPGGAGTLPYNGDTGGIDEFFRDRSELLKTTKPGDPDYDTRYRVIPEKHKDRIAIIGPWVMKIP